MTQQHPITPPPVLVQQWWDDFNGAFYEFEAITATVFQAGADQELEACCEWLSVPCPSYGRELRNARRPKPPSLKEQALQSVKRFESGQDLMGDLDTIRCALEQLPDNN
jgi:hypothetical protein